MRLDVSILDIGDRTTSIHIAVPLLGRRETVQARNPLAKADLGHFGHIVEPVFDVAQPVVRAVRFGVVHHDDHILVDIAVRITQRSTPREQVPDFGVSAFVVSARKNFPEVVIHRELNVLPPAHRFTLFGRDVRIVEQADPKRILFPFDPENTHIFVVEVEQHPILIINLDADRNGLVKVLQFRLVALQFFLRPDRLGNVRKERRAVVAVGRKNDRVEIAVVTNLIQLIRNDCPPGYRLVQVRPYLLGNEEARFPDAAPHHAGKLYVQDLLDGGIVFLEQVIRRLPLRVVSHTHFGITQRHVHINIAEILLFFPDSRFGAFELDADADDVGQRQEPLPVGLVPNTVLADDVDPYIAPGSFPVDQRNDHQRLDPLGSEYSLYAVRLGRKLIQVAQDDRQVLLQPLRPPQRQIDRNILQAVDLGGNPVAHHFIAAAVGPFRPIVFENISPVAIELVQQVFEQTGNHILFVGMLEQHQQRLRKIILPRQQLFKLHVGRTLPRMLGLLDGQVPHKPLCEQVPVGSRLFGSELRMHPDITDLRAHRKRFVVKIDLGEHIQAVHDPFPVIWVDQLCTSLERYGFRPDLQNIGQYLRKTGFPGCEIGFPPPDMRHLLKVAEPFRITTQRLKLLLRNGSLTHKRNIGSLHKNTKISPPPTLHNTKGEFYVKNK